MNSQSLRYIIIAAFACLLGALAHAGISQAVQDQHKRQPALEQESDTGFGGLEARLTSLQSGTQSSSDEQLQNDLLQKLWDVLDAAEDLSAKEKSDARAILEEADPILTRIKKDNEKAIQILRNPPRRVLPERAVTPESQTTTDPAPTATEG